MSLLDIIADVDDTEKTLTVFNASTEVSAALAERFADRNLTVDRATTLDGPDDFAVLSDGDVFLTGVSIAELLGGDDETTTGFDGKPYQPVLDHLDETLFTSYDREKMVSASREIEDRAWRVGSGTLHAGFQRLENLAPQTGAYERLGGRGSLSVHTYAVPGETTVEPDAFTLHRSPANEIEQTWFVAYDGGGTDANKCALLAEERLPGEFYGFWTYDPDTVDAITMHLTSTFAKTESDGGRDAAVSTSEVDGGLCHRER